jgi:hypothetical protein
MKPVNVVKFKPGIVDLYEHKGTDTMYISIPSLINILNKDSVSISSSQDDSSIKMDLSINVLTSYIASLVKRIEEVTIS